MCVHIYIYIYIYITYIYACIHKHIHVHVHACMYVWCRSDLYITLNPQIEVKNRYFLCPFKINKSGHLYHKYSGWDDTHIPHMHVQIYICIYIYAPCVTDNLIFVGNS
jgi:hypothetical protein